MAEGRTLRATAGQTPARYREELIEPTRTRKVKKPSFLGTRKSQGKSQATRSKRKGFFPKTLKSDSRRGLTSILQYIYGNELMNALSSQKILPRKTLEHIEPDAQCNAVIGRLVYETPASLRTPGNITKCWICGLTLRRDDGDKPECEHILPIAEATMFLGLHKTDAEVTKLIKKEYGWSHKICNRVKGAMFPLSVYDDKFIIDDKMIRDVLQRIYDSRFDHADKLRERIRGKYQNENRFIQLRTDAMIDVYQGVIDTITNSKKGARLSLLAATASLFNRRPNKGPFTARAAKILKSIKSFPPPGPAPKHALKTVKEENEINED
jgi:hypothetical protein